MANFPTRPSNSLSGSQFISTLGNSPQDELIVQELLKGNIPNFLKQMVPITISDKGSTLTYKVIPDYLAIGDDNDYVRASLGGPAAQKVADSFGCILPTPKMSDQIWKEAKVKLAPKPLQANKNMADTETLAYHNQLIQNQLQEIGHKPGELVAGNKKDIVISNDLVPGRLALHGLHDQSGNAIQQGGLSKHNENFKDYSSGIRLVDKEAILNGKPVDLVKDVLQNPQYAYLVNDGVLTNVAYKYKEEPKDTMIASSPNGRMKLLERINKYLDDIKIT